MKKNEGKNLLKGWSEKLINCRTDQRPEHYHQWEYQRQRDGSWGRGEEESNRWLLLTVGAEDAANGLHEVVLVHPTLAVAIAPHHAVQGRGVQVEACNGRRYRGLPLQNHSQPLYKNADRHAKKTLFIVGVCVCVCGFFPCLIRFIL